MTLSTGSAWLNTARLTLLLLLGLTDAAHADWRVSDADIVLSVALDGSMLVRETLTVKADASHRTPYRDLPLRTLDSDAAAIEVDVMQVAHAGRLLPWRAEPRGDALRVHLGSPQRRIAPGTRTYELLYHVDGHLAVAGAREWLLWQPLGAGMPAAVSRLHVTVAFARAINGERVSVEVAGAWRTDVRHDIARDGTVTVESRRGLRPGAGPAMLIGWPRGHLLTASDSEVDPWMRPRLTSLWWAVAALAALAAGAWLAGRRATPARHAMPAGAVLVSLASLYAAGAPASRDPGAFPVEFSLALAGIVFAIAARHWLAGAILRIAYIVIATALASTVTVRWAMWISPWYPLLFVAHADLVLATWWRARRPPRGASRPAPDTPDPSPPILERRAPAADLPHDDGANDKEMDDNQLPDGRRIPYFDPAGPRGERRPLDDSSRLSPPRAAGKHRPGAFAPRPGRLRKY